MNNNEKLNRAQKKHANCDWLDSKIMASVLNRRGFLAGVCASPVLFSQSGSASEAAAETELPKRETSMVTDFSRSFIHYVPKSAPIWVRIRIDCRCEVLDRTTGHSDEYVLGVRTQTGLRTDPPSDAVDPGYDFWMIFSKKYVYIKRVQTSSYNRNPSRIDVNQFKTSGWHLQPARAACLRNGSEIREASRAWKPLVARTEFQNADGTRAYVIEYPVKWSDGNDDGTFRVETGPVLLLDPQRIEVGKSPEFDDWKWAYLDYRSFEKVRCFIERRTSILSGATYGGYLNVKETYRRNPPLTAEQVDRIEKRLFSDWEPPIPFDALRELFKTNHYSSVAHFPVVTRLYALD